MKKKRYAEEQIAFALRPAELGTVVTYMQTRHDEQLRQTQFGLVRQLRQERGITTDSVQPM